MNYSIRLLYGMVLSMFCAASLQAMEEDTGAFLDSVRNLQTQVQLDDIKEQLSAKPSLRLAQGSQSGFCPLETILSRYDAVSADVKKMYQDLFGYIMRLGPCKDLQLDFNKDGVKDLKVIDEEFKEVWIGAVGAVKNKNIAALDLLIENNEYLLSIAKHDTYRTLLHEAAEQFDGDDPQSVQMFAYLMRKGADYTVKDGSNASVEDLVLDGTYAAAAASFKAEKLALERNALGIIPDISLDQLKQTGQEYAIEYKQHILVGVVVSILGYLLLSSNNDSDTQPIGKIECIK